jgi:membrane protease YdiL (CAAX protease family)
MSILDYATPESPKESPGTSFGIAIAAFLAYWVVTPAIFFLPFKQGISSTSQPSSPLSDNLLVTLSIASPIVGLITLFVGNLLFRKRAFERMGFTLTSLRRRGWKQGLIAAAMILPAMFAVVFLTQKFWDLIHFAHPNEHDLLRVLGEEPSRLVRVAIIISAIVLAPLFEEFFFRGMIQSAVRESLETLQPALKIRNRWIAIVFTSLIFTMVHGALWLAPPIFFLSLCIGYAYERTRNLWTSIIVHASFNAASVAMFLVFR